MGLIFELEEATGGGGTPIPTGTQYLATVTDLSLKEYQKLDERTGKPIVVVIWKFRLITDDEHNDRQITGRTSTAFVDHPDCKLKRWSENVLGMTLPPHYKLDTDQLLDRECLVAIELETYVKEGEERQWNKVVEVHPTRKAAASLAATSFDDEPF